MALAKKSIQIFKAGTYTSNEGMRLTFSERDLEQIASNYDPSVHEAPFVVGHPKDDSPAVGWVKGLVAQGGALEAEGDITASFREKARDGEYRKLSASFYMPNAPENPKPGGYYLRHVGFLGAAPPAVKGLRQANFSADRSGVVSVDFAEPAPADTTTTPPANAPPPEPLKFAPMTAVKTRGKVGTIIEARDGGWYSVLLEGDTEPVRWIAADELELSTTPAANAPTAAPAPAPAPAPTVASHAERARTAELDRREAKLRENEAKVIAEARRVERVENAAFLEGLQREGRVLMCPRETVVSFLECLGDVERGHIPSTASFGEGEKRSLKQIFRQDFLARLPKQVSFNEVSGEGGLGADATPEQIANAASKLVNEAARNGEVLATSEAVARVLRG